MSTFGGYEDQSFVAEYYDFIPGYAGRPDLEFYLDFSRSAGGKILELGCGTGRILIPTAAAGCQIVGLDISEYMLAKCREKLQNQPKEVQERVRLVHGNMTNFKLKETFRLITTPFRPFQHLGSIDDQLACLRCVNCHLTMGGKLILDLFQVNFRKIFDPVYTKESEDFPEVEHLLARCGFRVAELFGNFDKSPLTDDSPEMIFVAEKCENVVDVRTDLPEQIT